MKTLEMANEMKHDKVTPYNSQNPKKEQVAEMFNSIAGKYDFLNHFFSAGIDHNWRKKAIRQLREVEPNTILDIATGTGDFAIAALKLNPQKVTGIDISSGMLDVGRKKIKDKGLDDKINFVLGDSEALPFAENTFDGITVGFGVRNFENLRGGLAEMYRVLKPGGKVVILEFSKPKGFPLKQLYFTYFKAVMPTVGRFVSKDKSAYTYLPQSVMAFPEGKEFQAILEETGFTDIFAKAVTGGIATIYTGKK